MGLISKTLTHETRLTPAEAALVLSQDLAAPARAADAWFRAADDPDASGHAYVGTATETQLSLRVSGGARASPVNVRGAIESTAEGSRVTVTLRLGGGSPLILAALTVLVLVVAALEYEDQGAAVGLFFLVPLLVGIPDQRTLARATRGVEEWLRERLPPPERPPTTVYR